MPPVSSTGVRASARRPSSAPSRTISNALATDQKFVPVKLKTAISIPSKPSSARVMPAPASPGDCGRAGDLDATAARMIAPCAAFSQYGLMPAKISAVPIVPSSATPISVPASVPRPPVMAVPPMTTAVMHFSSRPSPALAGTSWKRTVASSAPIPTSMPATAKTQNTTRRGSRPVKRAASRSDPAA